MRAHDAKPFEVFAKTRKKSGLKKWLRRQVGRHRSPSGKLIVYRSEGTTTRCSASSYRSQIFFQIFPFSASPGTDAALTGLASGQWLVDGENEMSILSKTLTGAAVGAAMLAASATTASAAIVCSGDVCWHTHEAYAYPRDSRVVVHEDNWRAGPHITFREHEGRGYWRGDDWVGW
jgi:hypothetical protein